MELLEREREREALATAIEESRSAGRVVLVSGEAGIGKTALVGDVCGGLGARRVLWGVCDPLITPRPLGALRDVAMQLDSLGLVLESGSRERLLATLLEELDAGATVLVVEDVHWADDATLDLLALVGRRLGRARGCLVLTYRSEAPRAEVRRVFSVLPRESLRRIAPTPLSAEAVALLAHRSGREPGDLHTVPGGNPFFVSEVLAAAAEGVPASVRDAVSLRVAGLGERARAVVELAAVVPGAVELWLVNETVGLDDGPLEAGLLQLRGETLAFRHDLARRAVEDSLSPVRRRSLDRLVLEALEAKGGADPARLAHHARRADDAAAVRRLAPAAARAAGAAGGHREALEQWEAALAAHDGDDLEALEGVAIEAYLCGQPNRALEARRALLERRGDDALRAGDDMRWLSRLLWWTGQGAEAVEMGDRAIAELEAFPDSRELAMALSGRSQLAMLRYEHEEAIALGTPAAELARRLGDVETAAHALTNVGTAMLRGAEHEQGRAMLEEAHQLAVEHGYDDHAARALVNLATNTLFRRRTDPRGPVDVERAAAFARERGLDGYLQYMLGVRANLLLVVGDWARAEADARGSLALGEQPGVSLCPALIVLGRLQARRGDPEASETLDEAWRLALKTGELQRLGPVAAGRAEHAWLDGDLERAADAVREAYALAVARDDPWSRGELAYWLWRAGEPVLAHPEDPPPYTHALAGDWRGAAEGWASFGFVYERLEALADGDEDAQLEALAGFDAFGAARAAAHLRRRLRAGGLKKIPRGPRAVTREAPGGLTPREREVLALVVQGATNAEIAQALVISTKTVDHHVSAVLGKLGVSSRRDAAAAAARLEVGG